MPEITFEYLSIEIVNYVQNQCPPSKFIEAGMDEVSANEHSRAFAQQKLESMGFDVGFRLVERLAKDQPYLHSDPIHIIKYLCKDFWIAVFGKQVDKLQTNNQGMYILHETALRWISNISCANEAEMERHARPYCSLAVGVVRGALHNLGMAPEVRMDMDFSKSPTRPTCIFVVVDHARAKAAANNAAAIAAAGVRGGTAVAPTSTPTPPIPSASPPQPSQGENQQPTEITDAGSGSIKPVAAGAGAVASGEG